MKTALIPILVFLSAAALSAPAECQTAGRAASKEASQEPEIPKSISQSVAGTLQYAEGNLLGLAEAMPETNIHLFQPMGSSKVRAASANRSSMSPVLSSPSSTNSRARNLLMIARGADTILREQNLSFSSI